MKKLYRIKSIKNYKELINKYRADTSLENNAVYKFLDSKKTPLYIGYSASIANRLYANCYFVEDLIESKEIEYLSIDFYKTAEDAANNEILEIVTHNPKYNTAYRNKKARLGYYLPFDYRLKIKQHYHANKRDFICPTDVIIKAIDQYFNNARQLELC